MLSVKNFHYPPYTNEQFGVFIENGANGFELQQNQFIKVEDNVEYAYGSYCQNLGWFNNDVRKNTYTDVDAGNLADETNAITAFVPRGLYYLCNTNTTRLYDFYVYSGSDIRRNQGLELGGNTFQSAGNIFTKANAPTGDFENNGPQVRHYHFGNPEKPLYFSGLTFQSVLNQNTCKSDYCLPPCLEQDEWAGIKSDYNAQRGLYQSAVTDMQAALASGDTALAEQKSNMAAGYRLRLDELSNTLSLHMAFDTTTYSVDSVRVWWQKMDSPVSDMVVARDYLAKGQNTAAYAVLDAIPTKYSLSEGELADLADYRSVMQVMQGTSLAGLSVGQMQQLLGYANNGQGISAAWAKNILTVKGYHFPPQPKPLGGERSQQQGKPSKPKSEGYIVSPNPAREQVRFDRADAQLVGASVVVTDATGRTVWRSAFNGNATNIVWQTSGLKSGIYFYTIQDVGGLVQSGRITIVK